MLTDQDIAMLRGRNYAHFVTINEDGTPQTTPLWIDVDDEGHVLVNTAAGRVKDRNVRRDPRVAVSVFAQDDPYRWISINGTVVGIEEGDGPLAHIDALARRYDGTPWTPVEGQVRVLFRIRPDRVVRGD
jgi:PPOX class probable F420-dependent enzyme